MSLPTVNAEARIIGTPELRYTASGQPVLNLRLVSNRRKYNDQTQKWEDTAVCWLDAAIWGKSAEAAHAFLQEKDLIVYKGELETREWEKDGEKRSKVVVNIREVGKVPPRLEGGAQGGGGQFQGGGGQFPSQGGGGQFQGQQQGGWGGQQQQQQGGWGSQQDEPPF